MKKFLSLVLALAMTLSLVTVTAGAKDFADSDELSGEQYEEAVNVMSEMGIIDGYAGGNFQPQGTLTRGAAAKIIACMMLGKTTAEALGTQAAPFKDVPAGSTFAGYIAYCVESGLIDGYADGTFRPGNTLTGFAFLKMLLTALGYDSSIEGYTGTNWTVNVAGRATQIGLTDGNDEFVGTRAATREEACLYAVNALQATLVEYENKGQEITVSDGTVITVRPSAPTYVTSNIAGAATSIDDTYDNTRQDYTVEFAEKYQPDLELDGDIDVFGRPSHTWSWKGNEIGSYVDFDKMIVEYTTKVTGRDLYDAIGRNILNDNEYDFYISVDGETAESVLGDAFFTEGNLVRTNTTTVGDTGNGVLTQVFVDTGAKEVYIAVINTYLAKALDDYDERHDEVTYAVWSVNDVTPGTASLDLVKDTDELENLDVSGEDFDITEVAKDDIALVRVADGEIQEILEPEVLSEVTITSFSNGNWISVDGSEISYADAVQYDEDVLDEYDFPNMKDTIYNVYLDPYGNVIGVEIVEEPNQYLFLAGIDASSSNVMNKTLDANVIFMDGKAEGIEVNGTKSLMADGRRMVDAKNSLMNTWCKYTVNDDGVYTLTQVATNDAQFAAQKSKAGQSSTTDNANAAANDALVTLDKSHITLDGYGGNYKRVYANDETVFLTAVTERLNNAADTLAGGTSAVVIDDVDGVATGIQNVSLKAWNAAQVRADDADYAGVALGNISNGVYTLFDDDGYVIAAMVVGEDDGTTTNYAFVTSSSMNYEGYSETDDEYTWTREAVVNGEVVTLTEKGDSDPWIEDMVRGNWYEVKYYADGTVRRVTNLSTHALPAGSMPSADFDDKYTAGSWNNNGKYINDIRDYEKATEDQNNVLLWDNLNGALDKYEISVIGSTLQIDNQTGFKYGFAVAPDAKTVLIQDTKPTNAAVKVMDEITEYTGGTDGLERAVRDLNNNKTFTGFIGAVFTNGLATSVVIYDKTQSNIDAGSSTVDPDSFAYKPTATQNGFYLDVRANTDDADGAEVYAATMQWLNDNGYTGTVMPDSSGNFRIYATDRRGNSVVLTTRLITMVRLMVNGVAEYVKSGTTMTFDGVRRTTISSTTPITFPVASASVGNTDTMTTGTPIAWGNNGKYVYDDLAKITVNGTAMLYQVGSTLTATGGWWENTTEGTSGQVPAGGLVVTTSMDGDSINIGHLVKFDGETDEIVVDGGTTTGMSISTDGWYKTAQGTLAEVDGGEVKNVTGDVTVDATSAAAAYHKITGLPDQTVATNFGNKTEASYTYAITGSAGAEKDGNNWYVKSGDTITVTFTLASGTVSSSDTITVTCAGTVSNSGNAVFSSSDSVGDTVAITITSVSTDGTISISA